MTFRSRFRPQSGWNCPETTGPRWTAALCLSQREKKEGTISSRRHGNPPMPRFSSLHLNSKCHQRTFWRLIYIFFFIEFDPSSDGIQSSGSSSQWAPCQPQHRDCLENTWLSAVAAHIDSVSFSGQSSSLFFLCFLRAVVIEPVGTRSSPVQRLRHELHTNPYITQFEWFSLFVPIDDRCLPSMSFDCIGSSFFLFIDLIRVH